MSINASKFHTVTEKGSVNTEPSSQGQWKITVLMQLLCETSPVVKNGALLSYLF